MAHKEYFKAYLLAYTLPLDDQEYLQRLCLQRLCNIIHIDDKYYQGGEPITKAHAEKKMQNYLKRHRKKLKDQHE